MNILHHSGGIVLLALALGGCVAPPTMLVVEVINITYLQAPEEDMPAKPPISDSPVTPQPPRPVVALQKIRSYPVCFYDDNFSSKQKLDALERLRKELAVTVKNRVRIQSIDKNKMLVEGSASELSKLAAMWPEFGCMGQPNTPAGVVKRESCQEDMRKRLEGVKIDADRIGEGRYYICSNS